MSRLDRLLVRTSRTFALSIPLLPHPARHEVTLAYLLFRIADTLEDAELWPRQHRLDALASFAAVIKVLALPASEQLAREWLTRPPCNYDGYLELLEAAPAVLSSVAELGDDARIPILRHTLRTIDGMTGFLRRADESGRLRLGSLDDLRDYCYAVAGIVGELLTELFIRQRVINAGVQDRLYTLAARFGEGLQLVNILKDSAADARQGRVYLPEGVNRGDVFALARSDLAEAQTYAVLLRQLEFDRGTRAFVTFPARLAAATLDRVERDGAGAKISRDDVQRILEEIRSDK